MEKATIIEDLFQAITAHVDVPITFLGVADERGVSLLGYARCEGGPTDLQDVADALPAQVIVLGAFASSSTEAIKRAIEVHKSGLCPASCVAAYISDGQLRAARVQPDGSLGPELGLDRVSSFSEWLKGYRLVGCELPVRLEVVDDGTTTPAGALAFGVQKIVRQLETRGLAYLADCGPSGRSLFRQDSEDLVESLPGPSSGGDSPSSSVVQCVPLLDTKLLAGPPEVPVFTYRPLAAAGGGGGGRGDRTATCQAAVIRLSVLCYVPRSCMLGAAAEAVTRGLVRQVQAAERVLAKQGGKVLPVRAHHFLPPGLGHHLTPLYPTLLDDPERNDEQLLPARQRLHALFDLPPNRPLLRPGNAVDLSGGAAEGGGGGEDGGGAAVARLRDVHLGLAAPGIGGTTVLVQGSYEYCHYMQDRFNDSGWGCAYRSLQTICSWFRLQKYTTKPIPSHKTIQQVLARLGDKPPSFVGSSNWIGAIELSYILDDYLGVTSKILTVNRGADIPSHARELAAHFASVGSPVMIGGGVLAYTLLGVRFNEQTGEAAFLILDPHYTGGEDLRKIQQGTWVGWKRPGDNAAAGGPLFVEDAFYNFLLPQRPNTV